MSDFSLPIFPENTAAVAVTTTVWIGVWVVVFFNLRFGWTLSGLVVPGYLVPLLIAKPLAAAVICAESVITYCLVYLLSERFNHLRGWSSVFGRDRFFALVITSVLVRAAIDGWLLPWLGAWVNDAYGLNLDYRNDLHSYGLIIVALMANYFWKPGLLRGITPLAVVIGCAYVIVRYGLIQFTNFDVGSLQYVYEDVATSLLASPKAYIILITTAYIASWMNLSYGWEYNGILIPSLLALLWHDPWKIAASLGEALVVFALASLVLKLPLWRRTTMEGGRKILLFFNVCYLYRWALGFALPAFIPDVQITDVYGFGYLLSTLLAVKAHDRSLTIRLARATIQVSMVGGVAGSLLGFVFTLVPTHWLMADAQAVQTDIDVGQSLTLDLADVVLANKILLYQQRVPDSYVKPTSEDLHRFGDGVRRLQRYIRERQPQQLAEARMRLSTVNYAVDVVQNEYLVLRERAPARGWGLYVLAMPTPKGLLVEVPTPLDEWATLEGGLYLFRRLRGGALAIAGASRTTNNDGSSDMLAPPGTVLAMFHRLAGRGNALQVRGYTRQSLRAMGRVQGDDAELTAESATSSLWIKGALPHGLDLRVLKDLTSQFTIQWQATPITNVLRDGTWSGFGELILSRRDRRSILARLAQRSDKSPAADLLQRKEGHLHHFLSTSKEEIAVRGSNQYVAPHLEELLYLDEEVLQPVIRIAAVVDRWSEMSDVQVQELRAAAAAAAVVDYRVVLFHDPGRQQDYAVLIEHSPRTRHWGSYVLRTGTPEPYVLEVVRPLYEQSSFEFGLALFERLQASALLIAGTHPRANLDGTADVATLSNKINLFNLVQHVLLRAMADQPVLVVQSRAIRAPVNADVMIATDNGAIRREELGPLKTRLFDLLAEDQLRLRFIDGSEDIAGYELGIPLHASSIAQTADKELVSLWLSPSLRTKFRLQDEKGLLASKLEAAEIPAIEADLYQYLEGLGNESTAADVPAKLRERVLGYLKNQDVVRLRVLRRQWPEYQFTGLTDRDSGQVFLLISAKRGRLPLVANLTGAVGADDRLVVSDGLQRDVVRQYIHSRATWLEVRAAP